VSSTSKNLRPVTSPMKVTGLENMEVDHDKAD